MTTTLSLQLARRPNDPPIATTEVNQSTTTKSKSKSKKSRAPRASTSKRKPTKAAPEVVTLPVYEQFGTLPANPSYHLARTAHAIRTARNIIVISGAGVSTPAIPDFRSSRGLFRTLVDDAERKSMYDAELGERNVERSGTVTTGTQSGMRSGKELFDVKCLTVSPCDVFVHPALQLLHVQSPDLLPHHHALLNHLSRLTHRTPPTPFHHYLKTLDSQGRLLRCYTQNIDGLEGKAGLDLRIPVEGDFPRRKRGGISRETSRKDGVFAKGPVPAALPPTSAMQAISIPISRLLNDVDEFPNFYCRQTAASEDLAEDGFNIDQVYAADNDPFCQMKTTAFVGPLPPSVTQPIRGESVARSLTGTIDTSATSVSGKIETEYDRDNKEQAQASSKSSMDNPSIQSQPDPEPEPKLPRCVPLHGTLASLECTRCSYSEPLISAIPLPGEMLPCPSCEDEQDERIESSQRPRSIGFLRASVLLYGEEHRHGDSIGAVVERDLIGRLKDERMDLLIVAGTTLQIPGVKRMIKEFAKALRTQPVVKKKAPRKSNAAGSVEDKDAAADADEAEDFPIRTILLNRDPPGKGKGGEWANTFDVWVQGDLQEFVRDWVVDGPSPEEMKPPMSAKILSVVPQNTQRIIEVTKVEGTKIKLSLEQAAPAARQTTAAKRKQPPSPDKTVKAKVKSRAKDKKVASVISFPCRKPGLESTPLKSQPSTNPVSPESTSGSSDVCVLIPYPPLGTNSVAASSPLRQPGKNQPRTTAPRKQRAQTTESNVQPQPSTQRPKLNAPPAKPRTAPTRRSTRQSQAIQPVTIPSTLPPLTPRKRTLASACSSPLTSVPSSDDEAEECSSQGMIEFALDVAT